MDKWSFIKGLNESAESSNERHVRKFKKALKEHLDINASYNEVNAFLFGGDEAEQLMETLARAGFEFKGGWKRNKDFLSELGYTRSEWNSIVNEDEVQPFDNPVLKLRKLDRLVEFGTNCPINRGAEENEEYEDEEIEDGATLNDFDFDGLDRFDDDEMEDIINSRHGWAVAQQFRSIIDGDNLDEQNDAALDLIRRTAEDRREMSLADALRKYLSSRNPEENEESDEPPTRPMKSSNDTPKVSPKALKTAELMIKSHDDYATNFAELNGQIFDNVKHLISFKYELAHHLENDGPDILNDIEDEEFVDYDFDWEQYSEEDEEFSLDDFNFDFEEDEEEDDGEFDDDGEYDMDPTHLSMSEKSRILDYMKEMIDLGNVRGPREAATLAIENVPGLEGLDERASAALIQELITMYGQHKK